MSLRVKPGGVCGLPRYLGMKTALAFVFAAVCMPCTVRAAGVAATTPPLRPLRLDDLFSQHQVVDSSVVHSPDGQSLALVMRRPENTLPAARQSSLLIKEVADDVWVQESPGAPLRNLTEGRQDDSGWWSPRWSPDGRHLAMLSTRGGNVTLWVWTRGTGALRQVSAQGVLFEQNWSGTRNYHWLDGRRLLVLAPGSGDRSPPANQLGNAVERMDAAWAKARRGEATASPVDSVAFQYANARLLLIDADDGRVQEVAVTSVNSSALGSESGTWWPAPDGSAVATVRPGPVPYNTAMRARMGMPRDLELRDLAGRAIALDRALPRNVLTTTVSWSPDGRRLAFFAYDDRPVHPILLHGLAASEVFEARDGELANPARLYRVDVAQRRIEEVNTGDVDLGSLGAPALHWTDGGELMVQAPMRQYGYTMMPRPSRGPQWGFTSGNAVAPLGQEIPLQWFAIGDAGTRTLEVVEGSPEGSREAREKALRHRIEQTIAPPAPKAKLIGYAAQGTSAVYLLDDRNGTQLWRAYPDKPSERLWTGNTYRAGVEKASCSKLAYTSLNNQPLEALLCLPSGYRAGRRYPMVVALYPGRRAPAYDADAPHGAELYPPPGGPELYAAAGYAFLLPSMLERNNLPLQGREEGWSMLMFMHGLLPAVDEAVRMGVADTDRVFVTGLSGGGWATMSVIGQTSRFKAAMAEAAGAGGEIYGAGGPLYRSNLDRHSSNPSDWVSPSGTWKLFRPSDVPWWRDAERYRRNDPMTYVDRVQTPVLLLHGDLDPVLMERSENFFNALVSMRKPARFVRYWGEGHGNQILANRRDQFQRTLAWFDQWGDILRDAQGRIVFEGDRVKSRGNAAAPEAADYAAFPLFQPSGSDAAR